MALGQVFTAARAMRALEAEPKKKRLLNRLLFDELDGILGRYVVDPTTCYSFTPVEQDWAIVVLALTDETGHVIEAWPLALRAHVKLAAIASVVARLPELSSKRRCIGRHRFSITDNAVEMAVSARQNARPSWGTERVDDKRIAEAY